MVSSHDQFQIARRCSDALFGYTTAAINATFDATARTLAVWSDMSEALQSPARDEPPQWYGAPRKPRTVLKDEARQGPEWPNVAAAFEVLARGSAAALTPQAPPAVAFDWWYRMPLTAVPAAWPWAYGLISSGVPGSVAWPMAEANAALVEVANRTAEAARTSFPACQSGNGYAWTALAFNRAAA